MSQFPFLLSMHSVTQHMSVATCLAGVLKACFSQHRLQSSGTAGTHIIKQSQTVRWAVIYGYLISQGWRLVGFLAKDRRSTGRFRRPNVSGSCF
ncbi:hypothetical protein XELAEV_18014750mg [Xenopus laevis]|uniref:Uncharacterized protein n=1 Tax=Xenopus laevis TaxID=8355 RepID=A0A974DHV3_XENLA|nr:hypothetical protein XELAEV_18014750mg [Xenopus laevis]